MNSAKKVNDLSQNRRARFDYEILETYEAGMELLGTEVKSVKSGQAGLSGSFAVAKGEEFWLLNASVPPYQPKNSPKDYNPLRSRRLLLHKKEIKELIGKTSERGLTLVPLKLYNKAGKIKILLGLARNKKKKDKRETIKKRETEREIAREIKRG